MGELLRSLGNLLMGRTKSEGELLDFNGVRNVLEPEEKIENLRVIRSPLDYPKLLNPLPGEDEDPLAVQEELLFRFGKNDRQTYGEHHVYENSHKERHYLYVRNISGPIYSFYDSIDLHYTIKKNS